MSPQLANPLRARVLRLAIAVTTVMVLPMARAHETFATSASADAPQGTSAARARIGLVLSGGGARGLAHVGVLKVLERERIPVDLIAGTSMGAIIGGLYASGMSAADMERELKQVDWEQLFSPRVGRQQLSQRRKEEDFELLTGVELGLRDGEFRAPRGAVSSRGLEALLRRYTLPVRDIVHFDRLPTAFRAVATDMETGEAVVLGEGDLALAMRSSMSVPAVFPPTEWEGRLLGDGGLVDNLPIDVARRMGAERLIVVNIGTPLAGRGTLASALGLTAQMINILTEQNVQRSLRTISQGDLLITPELGTLSSADFNQAADFIRLGEAQAQAMVAALRAWSLPEADYLQWREARRAGEPRPPILQFVAFEGSSDTEPTRLAPQLGSRRGEPFDAPKAERDLVRLAASGDYVRADYRLLRTEAGEGLVFELEDKPWGPNYFNIGLHLSTDLAGASGFNILVSHNRHWLTGSGTEWRNQLQIGEVPTISTEIYHPLNWTVGLSNDWFSAAHLRGERRTRAVFEGNGGPKLGDLRRSSARAGFDLGQAWGTLGELRLGSFFVASRDEPLQESANIPGLSSSNTWQEAGVRARLVLDQLDFANFPQRGYRAEMELASGAHQDFRSAHFWRVEAEGTQALSWQRQTLNLHVAARWTTEANPPAVGRYALGGFQNLSGYQVGQVSGNALVFARLSAYRRFAESPVFARGMFFGGSIEAGNAWARPNDIGLNGLRQGASLYLGADTGIGPMYAGLTWAPRGQPGLIVFLGRP